MKYRALVQVTLASSVMLFAGTSIAMGPGGQGRGQGQGQGGDCNGGGDCTLSTMQNAPVSNLTASQASELIKMREEEKLARDVYAQLGDRWNAQVFQITNAEQKHMNAMKKMLDRFGMADPISTDARGQYSTKGFTDLYNQLIESGSGSLLDALKVGAKIEELDLADLRTASAGVNDPVLTKVYDNLQRATRNHLRAFAKQIQANGGTYEAEFLSQEEFDTIAASPMERGMGGQGKGQGQGKAGQRDAQDQRQGNSQRQGKGKGRGGR